MTTVDPGGREPDETDVVAPAKPVFGNIVSGLSWNTGGQFAAVLLNLALTPFLLARLGVDRYGVFALVATLRGLLSNIDGGLGPTGNRYFAVHAGSGDRRSTSSLLVTLLALSFLVVGALCGIVALVAPQLTSYAHTSPELHREAARLLREFMPLLLVSTLRAVLQRILIGHHRWAYLNATGTIAQAVYVAASFAFVADGLSLTGLVLASACEELVMVVSVPYAARKYIDLRDCRLMSLSELRPIVRYAVRVQIAEVGSAFNFEIDGLLVALIFPVRYVTFYSIGSNISSQLSGIPSNALNPIGVTLSRTFGRFNLSKTLEEFAIIQRVWVRTIAAFPLVGAVAVLVGVDRWLGPQTRLAGVVAAILLVGQSPMLMSGVMDGLGKAANLPGLESRYLGVGMIVNVAFTVPLAFLIGMLGVPIGTALGQITSSVYFLRIARRQIDPDLPSFVPDFPVVPVLLAIGVTALFEIGAFEIAPRGALGLVTCAVPACIGLGTYALATLGRERSVRGARELALVVRGLRRENSTG